MTFVHKVVDKTFRKLFNLTRQGKLAPSAYKQLFLSWEQTLDDYMEFVDQLPEHFKTPHVEKTLDKKREVCLKVLRQEGLRRELKLCSGLGEKLFKAARSTELIFKILGEYVQSCNVSLDQFYQAHDAFMEWRQTFESNIKKLDVMKAQLNSFAYPKRGAA